LCLITSMHLFCERRVFIMVRQELNKRYLVLVSSGILELRKDR